MKHIFFIYTALIFAGYLPVQAQAPIVADHTVATLGDLQNIPETYITAAKANLHIAYEHSSHGSQITEGMTGLAAWKGSTYAFSKGGGSGTLDFRDHDIEGWADLGNLWEPKELDFEAWEAVTRTYLAKTPGINVIMWAWCSQLSYDATEANVNTYLSLMSGLEEDYPNIKFIYMTGHVDGRPPNTNLYQRNAQIRSYCIANNKILFDFGDIESYDPDGNFYAEKLVTDCCNYDYDGSGETETDGGDPGLPTGGDRNWALDWQESHTQNVDWYDCEASHTYPLNANMKAFAAWWLWARLAGWNGENVSIRKPNLSANNQPFLYFRDSDRAYIELNDEAGAYEYIAIYDTQGKRMLSESLDNNIYKINLSDFPSGIYIVDLLGNPKRYNLKVSIP
ncbi:MAG: T9SS type A sorting domain-containing protein [Bacteroidales bacterium]|nr:T9SS type A sorting domain-containing protein [Bacteroidales bacterium]MBN2762687.1 T9SS type A sorting domain-containing protein [Bacteroidales bacterium]